MHRTKRGELVRSKSEVIIADLLHELNVTYDYEVPFTGDDGRTVRPDFTITTDIGTTVLWEHLGMLGDPRYEAKWKQKRAWYAANGVLPHDEVGARKATLVVTDDVHGVDSQVWLQLARKALGI